MKVHTLSPTDRMFHLATHRITVDYADVAALGAAANAVLALLSVPANTAARFAGSTIITAFDFSDAGITSMLAEVGDGGDTDRLLTQTEVAVDGTEVLYKVEGAVTQPYAYLVADTIDLKLTVANGGSPLLSECTSGEMEIYLWIEDRNKLKRPAGALL